MDEIRDLLVIQNAAPSMIVVLINLVYCLFFSFLLRSFFLRYSTTLVAHNHIGNIIPILSVVVFLVILVVKSSIALSLGLVGALSIVRFRTPIKEPEELVYLFFAIAIGLGFAAGQAAITAVITVVSLLIFYYVYARKNSDVSGFNEFNMTLSWSESEATIADVSAVISEYSTNFTIVRVNCDSAKIELMILFEGISTVSLDRFLQKIREIIPASSISIFQQQVNW